MRAALGLVVLNTGFLALGQSILYGLGLVRSGPSALRYAGLALVTGWALTGVGLSFLLVAGLGVGFPETLGLWAVLCASGLAAARVVPAARLPPGRGSRLRALWAPALVVLGGYLTLLLVRSAVPSGRLHPDAWNFWLPKAKAIFHYGGLDTGPSGFTAHLSPDYPPLVPALEALTFRFAGSADPLLLPLQHWVIAAAFVGALAALLAGRVPPAILYPAVAILVLTPRFGFLVGSSLGDEALSFLFALAGTCAALTLLHRDARLLGLCSLFLAAACLAKNEGVMLSAILVVALAVAAGRRAVRWTAALAVLPIVSLLAWRAWLWANDVPSNPAYGFGNLLHPGYLAERLDRLEYGGRSLLRELFSIGNWFLVAPAALVLAGLVARARGALTVLTLSTTALGLAGFAVIYWTSPVELHFYVDNNVDRIVSPIAFFLGALAPLLLAEAFQSFRR